jgi:hypothetical protein
MLSKFHENNGKGEEVHVKADKFVGLMTSVYITG